MKRKKENDHDFDLGGMLYGLFLGSATLAMSSLAAFIIVTLIGSCVSYFA